MKPKLLGETMLGSDRLGYAVEIRGLRCVVWYEDKRWCGSVSFNNRTIDMVTNDSASKQDAADKIEAWFVSFAKEILQKAKTK